MAPTIPSPVQSVGTSDLPVLPGVPCAPNPETIAHLPGRDWQLLLNSLAKPVLLALETFEGEVLVGTVVCDQHDRLVVRSGLRGRPEMIEPEDVQRIQPAEQHPLVTVDGNSPAPADPLDVEAPPGRP